MNVDDQISNFLSSKVYAVAGASKSRYKYGNKVLRCYKQHSKEVYAINPNEIEIESVQCFKNYIRMSRFSRCSFDYNTSRNILSNCDRLH